MAIHPHIPASTMDALVWTAPRTMEMQAVPVPVPGDHELLLEVAAVGICGSELSGYLGYNSLRVPPLVMGHEFSARVVQAGNGKLADGTLPLSDQFVTVNPLISCGECELCVHGLPHLCPRRRLVGAHRSGAFARYVVVPAAQCWPLPPGMGDVAGALVEPLACAVRAVRHAAWHSAEPLLILGAGAIGLCCLAVARADNPAQIVISDVVDARLHVAKAWGATDTVNGRAAGGEQRLQAALPGGAVAVIDAVGSSTTRASALQLVRPGGRVIYIGLHDEESPLAANYLVRQEINIQGSFAYAPGDFARALALLDAGIVTPSTLWIEERPLHDGPAAFAGLVDGSITTPKIVLRPT
jgi:threonine dehydrogenase-like Zn-dependent dehydrogenase